MKPALCFHGFLGSTEDFGFFENHYDLKSFDLKPRKLNEGVFENWDQMKSRLTAEFKIVILSWFKEFSKKNINPPIQIFSYSMGSKVMFSILEDIAAEFEEKNIKFELILLSTHFGLYENQEELDQELINRKQMNERFLTDLNQNSLNFFLNSWNSQNLFSFDSQLSSDWNIDQIKTYFKFWNRSQIRKPWILTQGSKIINSICVFYGSEDLKYKTQANRLKLFFNTESFDQPKIPIHYLELKARSHRIISDEDLEFIFESIKSKGNKLEF